MADSIPWVDHSRHSSAWEALSISGLSHLDHNDEVWKAGCKGVQAGLESVCGVLFDQTHVLIFR
jgi:hypothetical protein